MGTAKLPGNYFPIYSSQIFSFTHLMLNMNQPQSWACLLQVHLQASHMLWAQLCCSLVYLL